MNARNDNLNKNIAYQGRPGAGPARQNLFLASLRPSDLDSIQPHLRSRRLAMGEVLIEQGEPLSTLHFVQEGIISSIIPMDDGHAVEVCMVGNEGFSGLEACHHPARSTTRRLVQAPGAALGLDAAIFRRLIRTSDSLQAAVADYDWRVRAEIEQSCACNAVHDVEQRLAKWLLRCHDRHQSDVMELTQEFLATMLGTQRTTVNQVARAMADGGAIRYSRGKVTVQSRSDLEALACECYSHAMATRDRRRFEGVDAGRGYRNGPTAA